MHVNYHGSRGKRASAPMAEINIIPLVDVVLVLLIIFMATTAFVKESELNINVPPARTAAAAPQEDKDINIALTRNKIYLDARPSTPAAIQAVMTARAGQARAGKAPEPRVIIKGDENIEYKRVVQVMDMARQAGLSKVALGTRLPEGNETTP